MMPERNKIRPNGARRGPAVILQAFLTLAAAVPAGAVFEDLPVGARQLGFGGAAAALEDTAGAFSNPALPGVLRKFDTGAGFLASERTTQGPAEFSVRGAWLVIPHGTYGKTGTFSVGGLYRDDNGAWTQKTMAFGWSSWQLLQAGSGAVDFGANVKILQLTAEDTAGLLSSDADSQAGAALDVGAVYRPDSRRTFGFSALNINRPSFRVGLLKDKAPLALRLGFSERHDDIIVSVDMAQRTASGGYKGNFSLNPGIECLWRTRRAGFFSTRNGLVLAERASALSAGFGWRRQAAEISYSMAVPLTGVIVPAHAVTLALRFGDRDVQSDYERLMGQEIKYRKDLVVSLDESARRENLLKQELLSMREEIEALGLRLRSTEEKKEQVRDEKERLEAVVRRQAAAEAELRGLAEKRRSDKLAQLKYDFSLDWQNYLKLKSGGAPRDVLKGALERMVGQYQDVGVDISQATLELRGMIGGR
ncbi:MAG: hypothetical protein A2234_03750 [Elusimicrobia bacterium RIFOXYA2_FULL_58_8]|nr:MAG: hypothetical protein A2234_03750 [Elusimicrobia bacterium RIFOXYA2_FULL_58_8]OGS14242.1 MAG: hypothetical protein A2285_05500 [Elusimicrobia bacterium RIFOXYA12_FULL_57_11]